MTQISAFFNFSQLSAPTFFRLSHHFPWLHQEREYDIMVRPKKNRSNEREIKTNFVLKIFNNLYEFLETWRHLSH